MEDKVLIREIHKGKKENLNSIAEKYYDDVYRFCCYKTGNGEDSYDLAQETFLRFIRYVDGYTYQNLKAYLLTIARNVCNDYFRACGGMRMEQTEEIDSVADTRERVDMESKTTLYEAIQILPCYQKEAVVLYFYYGFKYREIAKITGTVTATVKSRVKQGSEKLRKMLREEDFYE